MWPADPGHILVTTGPPSTTVHCSALGCSRVQHAHNTGRRLAVWLCRAFAFKTYLSTPSTGQRVHHRCLPSPNDLLARPGVRPPLRAPIGGIPVYDAHHSLDIDSTTAGKVFSTQQASVTTTADIAVLTVPLTSRGHRIGVLELNLRGRWTDSLRARVAACAEVLTPLLREARTRRGRDGTTTQVHQVELARKNAMATVAGPRPSGPDQFAV